MIAEIEREKENKEEEKQRMSIRWKESRREIKKRKRNEQKRQ